ncbi:MAG: hypothetical protein ACOX20_04785 [Limnochordia bacterium]
MGTMYPVGAVIADMIMENIPGTNANPVVGGSITNIELVNKRRVPNRSYHDGIGICGRQWRHRALR